MDAVDQVWQTIEAVPKVKCAKCEREKTPCLFEPSELTRKSPRCRMCRQNRHDGSKVMTKKQIASAARKSIVGWQYGKGERVQ